MFVDYKKAFCEIKHENVCNMLQTLDSNGNDLCLSNLYCNRNASVRLASKWSMRQNFKKGVKQCCVFSPDLFNVYNEFIMRDLKELEGKKFGGKKLNTVQYSASC